MVMCCKEREESLWRVKRSALAASCAWLTSVPFPAAAFVLLSLIACTLGMGYLCVCMIWELLKCTNVVL